MKIETQLAQQLDERFGHKHWALVRVVQGYKWRTVQWLIEIDTITVDARLIGTNDAARVWGEGIEEAMRKALRHPAGPPIEVEPEGLVRHVS